MTDQAIISTVQSTDRANSLISDIFGVGYDRIITGNSPTGAFVSTIIDLFSAFNAVTLALVMALMFYTISTGVMHTAHEGESLGKRYHSLWTPLRGAFSVSLLMPLPWFKISLLQALVLKFVFLSIGAAGYLSNVAIDSIVKNGTYSLPQAFLQDASLLGAEILKNLVVQEYSKAQQGIGFDSPGYYISKISSGNNGVSSIKIAFNPPNFDGFDSEMGELSVTCNSLAADLCNAETSNVLALIGNLRPIAQELGQEFTGDGTSSDTLRTQFNVAINSYASASQQSAANAIKSSVPPHQNEELTNLQNSIKNNGFAWLGTFYLKMAKLNESAIRLGSTRAGVSRSIDLKSIAEAHMYKEFSGAAARTEKITTEIKAGLRSAQPVSTTSNDDVGLGAMVSGLFSSAISSTLGPNSTQKSAASLVAGTIATGTGDPVLSLQRLGVQLTNSGTTLILGSAVGSVASTTLGFFAKAAGMIGAPVTATFDTAKTLVDQAGSIAQALGLALTAVGLTLGTYLPMIPFILYTSAVVGWLILTLEMMVAAPIWAATGVIANDSEGLMNSHQKQGFMLFFGILFRPSLIVISFFLAMIASTSVGHFVGDLYQAVIDSNGSDNDPYGLFAQILSFLATLILGLGISGVMINKCFSLIHYLPDQILKWAGDGGTLSQNEAGANQSTHTVLSAAAGKVGGFTGAASSAAANLGGALTPKPKKPDTDQGDRA